MIAYADDVYIKTKLSVEFQVLTELKCVLKEDSGLELHVVKTSVLPKGVSQLRCPTGLHNTRQQSDVVQSLSVIST